jgi:hypothetical protein
LQIYIETRKPWTQFTANGKNHIDWEMFKYFNYMSECKEKGEEREAGRVRGGGGGGGGGGDVQESDQGLRQ